MEILKSKYLPWVIAITLLILLLYVGCSKEKSEQVKIETKYVPYKIPEVIGKINTPAKRDESPIGGLDTVYISGEPIYISSPIDEVLKEELSKTKNAYQLLIDANRKRQYSEDFEDSNVKINVKTTTYGKLDSTKIEYKLKEKEIKVPETTITKTVEKKDNFGLLLSGGANRSLTTQSTNFEFGAGIRVKNISILGTFNTDSQAGIKLIAEF